MIRIISAELDEQTENFTQMITEEVNHVDTQLIKAAKANSDISGRDVNMAKYGIMSRCYNTAANSMSY